MYIGLTKRVQAEAVEKIEILGPAALEFGWKDTDKYIVCEKKVFAGGMDMVEGIFLYRISFEGWMKLIMFYFL